jgi:hypothetical protein
MAINILKDIPAADTAAILRECAHGDENHLTAAITANHKKSAPRLAADELPVPAILTLPPEKEAFVAASHAESERVVLGKALRPLKDVLPQLVKAAEERAGAAAGSLKQLGDTVVAHGKRLQEAVTRRELDFARFNPLPTLLDLKHRLVKRERWLVIAEAVAVAVAVAGFMGLTDASGDTAPIGVWLQAVSLALSTVIAGYGLAWVGARVLPKGPPSRRVMFFGALGIVAAGITFAIAQALMRYAAADSKVSLGMEAAGSIGLSIIVALASAVVFATVLITRRQLIQIDAEIVEVTRRSENHRRTTDRLTEELATAEEKHTAAQTTARIVAQLEQAFEASVQLIAEALRKYEAVLPDRLAKAVAAFRALKDMSAPEREVVATTAFSVEPADSGGRANGVLPHGGRFGAITRTLPVVILSAFALNACADHRSPHSLTVICDGSGAAAEVCSPAVVAGAFTAWVSASPALGSHFDVLFPKDSLASVVVRDPITIATHSRAERRKWVDETARLLATEPLPNVPDDDRDDVSDLISPLILAADGAKSRPSHQTDLLIASDGLFVSLGFNCEKRVPSANVVLARLKQRRIVLDLSAFASITICGFSHDGQTPRTMQAREKLWRELVTGSHGPTPLMLPSCRGLFPIVPVPSTPLTLGER